MPQYSTAARNARLDSLETTIGTAPILRVYTGSAPSAPSDAATGTLLAEMTLPSDWMAAASGGTKALSGTWEDTSANADGTPGYFRIWDSGDTTTHIQGTAGVGSGELDFQATFVTGQPITVTSFTLTEGNA